MGMIALDRRKLLDKIVKGSEICEVLHGCPEVQKYLVSGFCSHIGCRLLVMFRLKLRKAFFVTETFAFASLNKSNQGSEVPYLKEVPKL